MKIEVKNYRNIKNLDLNIINNKINFIFGISGSGKTSISKGLLNRISNIDVKIGETIENCTITNDENKIENDFRVYDENTKNNLIVSENESNDIYNILFDNSGQIATFKEKYRELLSDLDSMKDSIFIYLGKYAALEKEMSIAFNNNGTLKSTSKPLKIKKEMEAISDANIIEQYKEQGNSLISWKISGTTFDNFKNKECPFCNQLLDDNLIGNLNKLANISPKNFESLIKSLNGLDELGIIIPEDFLNQEQFDKFTLELKKAQSITSELRRLLKYLNIDIENIDNITELVLNDDVYELFEPLKNIVENININISNLKSILGRIKTETDRSIGNNTKRINDLLNIFGIPYNFEVLSVNDDSKEANYILSHIGDDDKLDRIDGLSTGEKNILSLLLFIIQNDDKIIIIDDPASSFDESRRKIILNLLYLFQNNRTMILLSHDHVFAKFTLLMQQTALKKSPDSRSLLEKKYLDNTGIVVHLENYTGIPNVQEIAYNDFAPLDVHIKKHVNSITDYYRKIINIRFLSELLKYNKTPESEIIYGYTSAIMHRENYDKIQKLLVEKSINENELVEKIKKLFNISELSILQKDYVKLICTDDYLPFEKAIYLREVTTDAKIKEELNDIIHLNDTYMICLNPYKYNYFSPYVYKVINE